MLQAMKEEPSLNIKSKDKFLIQRTLITAEMDTVSFRDIVDNIPCFTLSWYLTGHSAVERR